jgi:hypothetical protein
MNWSDFYLLCFLVGFSLSALSFLAGAVHIHLPFKMHLPFHGGSHATAGPAHGLGGKGASPNTSGHVSWFNASTAMAFLAWFGGTGYILTKHSHLMAIASLGFASLAGVAAGRVVLKFMVRLMRASESEMNDADYRMEGSLGSISVAIRQNGTGEVIFVLGGVRRSAGARSEDGKPIAKGAEVAIERYENGIAYVKPWEEFTR